MRIMQSHTSSSELSHAEGLGGPSFLLTAPGNKEAREGREEKEASDEEGESPGSRPSGGRDHLRMSSAALPPTLLPSFLFSLPSPSFPFPS